MALKLSVKELAEAGAHYGHVTPKWHPKMKQYIYGAKSGVYIIDLRKTLEKLKEAYEYAVKISSGGGRVLFVGTKPLAREAVKAAAESVNGYYINQRWLGGTLTNFSTLRQSVNNMENIESLAGKDFSYEGILKKEANKMEKERQKLMHLIGGIRYMKKMPAAIFMVDPIREHIALKEAMTMGIPVVSIVDTNCNPDKVNYPIPGNDDSINSVDLLLKVFVAGLLEGRAQFDKRGGAPEEEGEEEQLSAVPEEQSEESSDDADE
ncbi:hypothetical protein CHS0354_026818 [Potamilus streckersoni]|uniref:30S ribosomal protein S2 n=1 Tax=Potamilus streckersoni TaxID=2493646 RepID=A0AAE0T562_9BIVA|nr:hypothetical protein CHS0354_026818 [Potamilus streckersoni]